MYTVREVARISGISTRTLHYYDEIGLLRPAGRSDAGYRLYDDAALERLRRILFFRELDLPLKQIRQILENPAIRERQILQAQKRMLEAERARLDGLIEELNRLLDGEATANFKVFNRNELLAIFQETLDGLSDELRQCAVAEFGSEAAWRECYVEVMESEAMQRQLGRMAERYGEKVADCCAAEDALSEGTSRRIKRREEALLDQICALKDTSPDSETVESLVRQWGGALRELCQLQDETGFMRSLIYACQGEAMKPLSCIHYPGFAARIDQYYGPGSAEFLARAIAAVYGEESATV